MRRWEPADRLTPVRPDGIVQGMRAARFAVVLAALCASALPLPTAAATYRWIGADGAVNYGDAPPAGARGLRVIDEGSARVSTIPAAPRDQVQRETQSALEQRIERLERELADLRQVPVQPAVVLHPGWVAPTVVSSAPAWIGPGWHRAAVWHRPIWRAHALPGPRAGIRTGPGRAGSGGRGSNFGR
jgi:hypothetical protein